MFHRRLWGEYCIGYSCRIQEILGQEVSFERYLLSYVLDLLWLPPRNSSDRYTGDYRVEDNGNISGNPANASCIKELRRSVVNRDKGQDTARNHAEAITFKDLGKIMAWSASACPGPCSSDSTLEQLLHSARHLMFRAYASTGFTLWSRYVNILSSLFLIRSLFHLETPRPHPSRTNTTIVIAK